MPDLTEQQRLEEELDFLLRSIDDLDAELAAGDLDPTDHATLVDGYVQRSAAARARLDRIDEAERSEPDEAKSPRSGLLLALGTLLLAGLAGVLVAQASGARDSSDTATGGIRDSARSLVASAHEAEAEQRYDDAIEAYDGALELVPSDAEALTYRAWNFFLTGEVEEARAGLDEAVLADPDYPDARAFRAIIASRQNEPDVVLEELEVLDASDPPPAISQLVESAGLRRTAGVGVGLDRARAATEAGEVIEALDAYDEVLAEEPNSYEALIGRAWLGAQPGLADPEQFEELLTQSEEFLDRAVGVAPRAPQARGLRAVIREALGNIEGATEDLDVVAQASEDPELEAVLDQTGIRERLTP